MASSTITVTSLGSGILVDTDNVTVGANSVHRQRVELAGSAAAAIADVVNAEPGATDYGLPVRPIGNIAHDSVDIGSPLKVGGKAVLTEPAVVSNLDRVDAWFQVNGALMTSRIEWITGKVTFYNDSVTRIIQRALLAAVAINVTTTVIAAPGASLYIYVIGMTLANPSANAGLVTFETQTGGTDVYYVHLPATSAPVNIEAPRGGFLFRGSVNDGINALGVAGQTLTGVIHYVASAANIA